MHIDLKRSKGRLQIRKTWKEYKKEKDARFTFIEFIDYGCGDVCYQKIADRYIQCRLGGLLYLHPAVELGDGSIVQLYELYDTHDQGYGDNPYTRIVLKVLKGHPTASTLETALGYRIEQYWIRFP